MCNKLTLQFLDVPLYTLIYQLFSPALRGNYRRIDWGISKYAGFDDILCKRNIVYFLSFALSVPELVLDTKLKIGLNNDLREKLYSQPVAFDKAYSRRFLF